MSKGTRGLGLVTVAGGGPREELAEWVVLLLFTVAACSSDGRGTFSHSVLDLLHPLLGCAGPGGCVDVDGLVALDVELPVLRDVDAPPPPGGA